MAWPTIIISLTLIILFNFNLAASSQDSMFRFFSSYFTLNCCAFFNISLKKEKLFSCNRQFKCHPAKFTINARLFGFPMVVNRLRSFIKHGPMKISKIFKIVPFMWTVIYISRTQCALVVA